ncbi:MAG: hypothetical protein ACOX2R_07280 [Anaerolineae bacterium]
MSHLVAFASLPFGMRGGEYPVAVGDEQVLVRVADQRFNPFLSVTSRPELAQSLPQGRIDDRFTSYTWYDHPFLLQVVFGRNVAALGSISSMATVVEPLPRRGLRGSSAVLDERMERFGQRAMHACNTVIAAVRRRAHLYQLLDLTREDIEITIRDDNGAVLRHDPVEGIVAERQARETESFDLVDRDDLWYEELREHLEGAGDYSLAEDLLLEAERALAQRFARQAVATCYSALEASAASLLTVRMKGHGRSDREIDATLAGKGLASKLDSLLRTYTGYSLRRDNHELWHAFYDFLALRNDVVHRGLYPSDERVREAMRITRNIMDWLAMVTARVEP